MLKHELAEKIVKEVTKLIDEDVIVVGTDGIIIASTDIKRLNTFHEGAFQVSKSKQSLIISKNDQLKLKGVKAGVNFPILFRNDVIGVIGITGDPVKVLPFGELIRKMTELLISENYYAEQFEWKSRAVEAFVFDWMNKNDFDSSFTDRAEMLNIDLLTSRQVVIMELKTSHPITREAWSSLQHAFQIKRNDVMVRWGTEKIVIFLDIGVGEKNDLIKNRLRKLLDWLKRTLLISAVAGIGQIVLPINVKDSYLQAERALKIARKKQDIVFDADLTLDMILDDITLQTKIDFLHRTIGTIINEDEIMETIRELFQQNYSLKDTAQSLHIHINTLHYRIKKFEERTGLNLKNMKDLMTLYLAIYLLDEKTKIQLKI